VELPPGSVYPAATADKLVCRDGRKSGDNVMAHMPLADKAAVLLDDGGNVLQAFASQSKAATALGISPSEVSASVRSDDVTKVVTPTRYSIATHGKYYYSAGQGESTLHNR
jgi:hypothetical protein